MDGSRCNCLETPSSRRYQVWQTHNTHAGTGSSMFQRSPSPSQSLPPFFFAFAFHHPRTFPHTRCPSISIPTCLASTFPIPLPLPFPLLSLQSSSSSTPLPLPGFRLLQPTTLVVYQDSCQLIDFPLRLIFYLPPLSLLSFPFLPSSLYTRSPATFCHSPPPFPSSLVPSRD